MCDVPHCPRPSAWNVKFQLWPKGYPRKRCQPATVWGLTVCDQHKKPEMFDGFFLGSDGRPRQLVLDEFVNAGKVPPDLEHPDVIFEPIR